MKPAKRRVIEASILFLAIFAPVIFIGESRITKPTFFFAWDAPSALWECWVIAGLGVVATLSEIFAPKDKRALRATVAALVSIVAAGMIYFLYGSTQEFATGVINAIKGQALLASAFSGGANLDQALKQIGDVKSVSYMNISAYIWTFVLAGYVTRSLMDFIGEARAAMARQ